MFNPTFETRLIIDDHEYTFSPHPVVPSIVWGQEGRHAVVYRVESAQDSYALKVFRPIFRHDGLIEAANSLRFYHELPGMGVCKQVVIHEDTHPDLVDQYEDLNYAMLMPWIKGLTWFDFLSARERITLEQSRAITESMAWILYALELNNLAHCDLSSGNVIVNPNMAQIHLIDVEDLYSPWLDIPPYVPVGSIGYQHEAVAGSGQWGPLGDRFAGAVLMAEMLGWAHPEVREQAWGESYFAPDELQQDSDRFHLLMDILMVYDPGFAETFQSAWRSSSLEECPPIKTWYDLLDTLPREPVANWVPLDVVDEFGPQEPEAEPEPDLEPIHISVPYQFQSEDEEEKVEEEPGGCKEGCRKGCRQLFMFSMVMGILVCYAVVLVLGLNYLSQNFFQ